MCLVACLLPATKWIAIILATVASVAISVPTIAGAHPLYSTLTYLVSAVVGVVVSASNILYVGAIVSFFMPMSLVKVWAESLKITTRFQQKTIDDPFEGGNDKQVTALEVDARRRMKPLAKWILYYAVLEIGLALTLFGTYLLMRPTFEFLWENNAIWWIVGVMQLLPIPYDFLLTGCFVGVAKTIHRHIK